MANKVVKTKKRLTRKIKILLWIVVVIGILALIPLIQFYTLRTSLASESTNKLNINISSMQNASDRVIKKASQELATKQTSAYSATYKSCYIDSNDSGWIANSYNYKCLLNNFSLFEVEEDSALMATVNQYAQKDNEAQYVDEVNREYYGEIYSFYTDKSKALNPEDLPREIYVVKPNTYTNAQDVLRVKNIYASPAVVTYASSEAFANRLLVTESGVAALDTSKTYVILRTSVEYFAKDIGCRMLTFFFCEPPTAI